MNKIYPKKLKEGDLVSVIASASSLQIISEETREIADKYFEELGLRLTFGKHVDECDEFNSSSIESRIEDLHDAFLNPDVSAVIPVIGGFNSNQLLDYIDYDLIAKNPKIFCGYSDITAMGNAIYAKTGLVNYSGLSYSHFGKILDGEYNIEYFKKCLFSDDPIDIKASAKWDDRRWWENQEDRTYFDNPGWKVINEGVAQGTIIGGNLCTLNLLQGTKYMPSLDNSILFIEDDHEAKRGNFDRDLQSLIHQDGFKNVKGIVIGRFQIASDIGPDIVEKIVRSKKELNRIPVIANVDFGHTDPKICFPIGGEIEIDIKESGSKILITKH